MNMSTTGLDEEFDWSAEEEMSEGNTKLKIKIKKNETAKPGEYK